MASGLEPSTGSLHLWEQDRHSWEVRDYTHGISLCARSKLWRVGCELWSAMSKELQADVISVNARIASYQKGRQWQQAIQIVQEMPRISFRSDVISFNASISSCGEWIMALDLFQDMPMAGIETKSVTSNAATSSFEKASQWRYALAFFHANASRDAFSFSTTMKSCKAEWQHAMSLSSLMLELRIVPSLISCNASASSCEKSRRWQDALKVLQTIELARLQADAISFNTIISSCGSSSEWQQALSTFYALSTWIRPDVVSFNSAMSACEKASEWEQALRLFESMPETSVHRDVVSFNAAISSCEKGSQWQCAFNLLTRMAEARVNPDAVTESALIASCEWQAALLLRNFMKRDRIQLNLVTSNALIASSPWPLAFQVLRSGLEPDVTSFSAVMSSCEWLKALNLLKHEANVANVISFSTCITACEKAGTWQEALEILQMLEAYALPNVISFNAAMSSCEKVAEWQRAFGFFDAMCARQIRCDEISCNAAVSSCEKEEK